MSGTLSRACSLFVHECENTEHHFTPFLLTYIVDRVVDTLVLFTSSNEYGRMAT